RAAAGAAGRAELAAAVVERGGPLRRRRHAGAEARWLLGVSGARRPRGGADGIVVGGGSVDPPPPPNPPQTGGGGGRSTGGGNGVRRPSMLATVTPHEPSRILWQGSDRASPTPLLEREWLVTNGLGGYASSSLAGVPTRAYHGLLITALPAPWGRMLLCNGV